MLIRTTRIPILIGDDLTLSIRARTVRVTPKEAFAIGARLIRQAAYADPALVAQPKARASSSSKRPRKKESR